MDNSDPFNVFPNSASTNPSNNLEVDGANSTGDVYNANYTTIPADCTKSDLSVTIGQPTTPFRVGISSNVPVTVTNTGPAASGSVTVTVPLPPGFTTMPGTFTPPGNPTWTCSTVGTDVICTNPGPINPGTNAPALSIPMTPGPGTLGDTPTLSSTVGTTNDNNPTNNTSPTITTDPVLGSPNVTTTLGQPSPTLHVGIPSSLPITVTNIGDGPTTGPTTVTLPIPTDVTVPGAPSLRLADGPVLPRPRQ